MPVYDPEPSELTVDLRGAAEMMTRLMNADCRSHTYGIVNVSDAFLVRFFFWCRGVERHLVSEGTDLVACGLWVK